jgi:hypothetical protein
LRVDLKAPLLQVLGRLTEVINARNPFHTLKMGLFHTDIPAAECAPRGTACSQSTSSRDLSEDRVGGARRDRSAPHFPVHVGIWEASSSI